jgi:CRP/FNR family transcriptional regulator, cyclic AMP receptor protein
MAADRELLARLRTVPLFEGLSDKELKHVLAQSIIVDHEAGRDIVEQGHLGAGFHLILEGQATVSQGSRIVGTIGPGDYFGEISVIDGKPRSATVMTNSPVRTLALAAWDFRPLLEAHPAFSRKILLGLCQAIRTAEAQLSEIPEW